MCVTEGNGLKIITLLQQIIEYCTEVLISP